MSGEDISLNLKERTVVRKGLGKLRDDGLVPAVIHDHGKPSIHVMADSMLMGKAYATAGKHHPVQLDVEGKKHLALIKDVDFEPVKHRMRHVVFQAIKQNEKVTAEIPVTFAEGVDIPAEKVSLLVLKQLDHVEVEALPKDLPDELVVDPGKLAEVGDHLTVADIKAPEGVTILTEPEAQIAIVEMPKDQIAEADAAAAALAEDKGQPEAEEVEAEHGAETQTEETETGQE
jgi:large subunit ribosomal protein L25